MDITKRKICLRGKHVSLEVILLEDIFYGIECLNREHLTKRHALQEEISNWRVCSFGEHVFQESMSYNYYKI